MAKSEHITMRWHLLLALIGAVMALTYAPPALAAGAVAVFPSPGTQYNLPGTQITFRGVPAGSIGSVQVSGSVTGPHSGTIQADSDGNGGSFILNAPFAAGETVTVTTNLNVLGGTGGTFHFGIENPAAPIGPGPIAVVPAGRHGVVHFHSRRDLLPPAVAVTHNSSGAFQGDIFVAPQHGPKQNGPMILDSHGSLLWFDPTPISQNVLITDFRVQTLHGQPVLTWWRGSTNRGSGRGSGIIFDRNYKQIATVQAGNGLQVDLHEFLVTNQGQAYIIGVSPVKISGTSKPTMDSVIQEIDIKTGLVLFEWHALDHIALNESFFTPKYPSYVFDPFHANSVFPDNRGNVLVSMRNTNAVYDIDHQTGQVIWRLGGNHSSFSMGSGTATAFQHDAVMQPDGTLTIFDDGAGPPNVHPFSRAIRERLDTTHKTATLIKEYDHSPQVNSLFEGGAQALPNGDMFLGWGQKPYFSEDNAAGQQIFDAHFKVPTTSYRAYKFQWSAQPPTQPALAMSSNSDGSTSLYSTWNGATNVSSWQVLLGKDPSSLAAVGSGARHFFETKVVAHDSAPYFAVQALDSQGHVLATSAAQATRSHIAIYGHSAFVPPSSGVGGVPEGCFTNHPCHIKTTVSAGRTVIAQTGSESVAQNSGSVVYFRLSAQGRSMLAHASAQRLPVKVTARDVSGASASVNLNLVPFSTSGSGPPRGVTSQSGSLQTIGKTDFVSPGGVGGILAACASMTPCHVQTTVSSGGTVISQTGPEFLGANELGYMIFTLTPQGRSMLQHAPGNQLGVQVKLSDGTNSASANLALVQFK